MYIHIHSQGPAVSPKCNHSPPTPAALSLSECGIECFRASFRKEMQKRVWKNKPTGDIFWAKFSDHGFQGFSFITTNLWLVGKGRTVVIVGFL